MEMVSNFFIKTFLSKHKFFHAAILVYRIFRNDRKTLIKILHATLQILSFIFVIVGLKAVFDSHNLNPNPIPNLYSLHSWVGLLTIIFFGFQWVAGFVTFLWPGLALRLKNFYKPIHVFWGVLIYAFALAAAMMGIVEKTLHTK